MRKFLGFILRSRPENVMAAGVSISLLVLFLTTRLFHSFEFGPLDLMFILLPMGVLGAKILLGLLASGGDENGEDSATMKYLSSFFGPLVKIVRDWFPFFLLGACYYSLYSDLILRVNPHTADSFLSKIDAFLFGNQPSFLLEPFIRPRLTDFLNVIYFSHVIFFPGVALFFYLRKEEKAFRRLMMGYLTIILMGVATYILVPAVGPEKFFAGQYTRDLHGQLISRSVDYIINIGRVSHDCFPSLHVGIPLLLSFYLRDYRRKAFVPTLFYVVLMCFATIYLRYHYFIDVLAAFVYAPAAYFLNDLLLRHWPGERISTTSLEGREKAPPVQIQPD
jgi:membrane-associated phospholipid phosphatase